MGMSELIGSGPRFRAVLDEVNLVAPVDCAVLLRGETGTGKEVIARAIHDGSARRKNPFVAVNCAAIPSGLIESELFGHERGAFTGAITQTTGRFQAAHRGTLFLDEIGDLPPELQPKLLRILQEQRFERIGGTQTLQVDARIIAASHQDIWRMVQEGNFRADLYYRINVFPINLPPLRDRAEDIRALVEHFVQSYAPRLGKRIEYIPEEAMEMLEGYHWPGNIRELQNVIERLIILSPGCVLRVPARLAEEGILESLKSSGERTLAEASRDHILETLQRANGVVGGRHGAAARLGMPRTTLLSRMRKLGIDSKPAAAHACAQCSGEGPRPESAEGPATASNGFSTFVAARA